jgi:hypothetical protein
MALDAMRYSALAAQLKQHKSLALTLEMKIGTLSRSRSKDPIQQLQTDVILELYQAIVRIQDITGPLFEALLPDTQGAREAAGHSQVGASARTTIGSYLKP